jgi:large subunit ribosomal protein L13
MKSIKDKIERKWVLIDAKGKILGRLATRIATILRGKDKEYFIPYWDVGDYVIVINASKIKVTGNKIKDKLYYKHSGYMGNLKVKTLEQMMKKNPSEVVYLAVKRMLPKNKLNRKVIKKLKVYNDNRHPHQAQSPVQINL